MTTPEIKITRVYSPREPADGVRVLVDRLWPRGLAKNLADIDEWCKDVAPSTELRRWFGHDPARFAEFSQRYRDELTEPQRVAALEHLRGLARRGPLTLLTATRDVTISAAVVLADLLREGTSPTR